MTSTIQLSYSFPQRAFTVVLLLLLGGIVHAQRPFVTIWKTDNPGISPDSQIVVSTSGTNFNIQWEEIGHPNNNGSAIGNNFDTIVFPTLGIYRVRFSPGAGSFHRISFSTNSDRRKLLGVEQWGDIAWSSMERAFYGCANLSITATDLPDLSGVTNTDQMFQACTILNGPDNMGDWNMATVTTMEAMFKEAIAFNQPIGNWNTAAVTNMNSLFSDARSFNQPIGDWNTAAVVDMGNMFVDATAFNQPIGSWNTSAVTNMYGMFSRSLTFNQPIGDWNTAAVTLMGFMFSEARSFNQPIGDWNTAAVVNMSNMFSGATAFNQPIGGWNTSAVNLMDRMFFDARSFNQPIGDWNTAAVTNMGRMFQYTTAFNQPIGHWDVSQVRDLGSTFLNATAFNQSIGHWTLRNVVNMAGMLDNSGIDCNNYSATLIGWSDNPDMLDSLSLHAIGMQYGTNAVSARNHLINSKFWNIAGDAASGEDCSLPVSASTPLDPADAYTLFPNPATTQVSVDLPAFAGKSVLLQVITPQGVVVEQRHLEAWQSEPLSFDLSHYPSGIYWVAIQTDGQARLVKKLVVAR